MKLYHGSNVIVDKPSIQYTKHRVDYGVGLYTTTSYQQAVDWVTTKHNNKVFDSGFVNVYEFDLEKAKLFLNLKLFDLTPSEEWLDFVEDNRTKPEFHHEYDAVYGPVANDRVYAAFALYESNVLNKQETIRELKTYVLKDQWLFHTEKSLDFLKFVEAQEIKFTK